MGRAIFYCGVCNTRVSEDAFDAGKAFRQGDRVICAACAPSVGITPPPSSKRIVRSSSTALRRLQASTPKLPMPAVPSEGQEQPPPSRRRLLPILVGAGAIAGVLTLAAFLVFSGGDETPAAAPEAAGAPAIAEPLAGKAAGLKPSEPARAEAEALEQARQYARQNPDDLTGQIREFEKVRWAFETSREAQEAQREVDALRAKLKDLVDSAMAELEKEVRVPLEQRKYAEAVRMLEGAQSRLSTPEWLLAVGRRLREVRVKWKAEADSTPPPAPPPAAADTEAKAAPAALPAEAKPRTEEGKAYLSRWEQSAARAAGRDFACALGDLQRGASELNEDATRGELAQDVKDLRDMETLHQRLLEAACKVARGRSLTLSTLDGKKVAGAVLRSDLHRVEVSQGGRKPTAFVEWREATAASLAGAAREAKPDARILALLALIEGDVEAARAALGGKPESAPAKYWTYAGGARERLPKPERRELDARELFYSAEREFRSMETRGPAGEKYRALQSDFAATAVVRSAADRIQRRADPCRDYFLAGDDFRWEGSFKPGKDGRLESREEMDLVYANRNWVELEFYAMAETPYRCWVLLGGCCQESFTFWLQGSEFTDVDAKTKKKISVEPGGKFGSPGKHSIRNLKSTHAACSPKKEPKRAARWEWVEIPLPKYAGPGPKRVRFLTNDKGFGVGAAVVSASRKAPPAEPEWRELERARAAETEVEAPPADPDLVAHWALDESDGNSVGDASGNGNGGTVSGKPKWGEGKIGGALILDGKESWVTIPDADALRIKGDLTIAFWIRKDANVDDWQRIVGKGDPTRRNYGVWTSQSAGRRLLWQQYDDVGNSVLDLNGQTVLETGRWYHVACVVAGTRAILYVDGKKDAEGARSGAAATSEAPVTLGHAGHHSAFPGALDDVRIYRRGLSAEEIQELFSLGR